MLIDAVNNNLINEIDKKIQALQGAESANVNLISSADSLIAETTTDATATTATTATSAQQINKTAREILNDNFMSGLIGHGNQIQLNRDTGLYSLFSKLSVSDWFRYLADHVAKQVVSNTTISYTEADVSNYIYDYIIQFEADVTNSFSNGVSQQELDSWKDVIVNRVQEGFDSITGNNTTTSSNTDSLLDKMDIVGENMANASESMSTGINSGEDIANNVQNKIKELGIFDMHSGTLRKDELISYLENYAIQLGVATEEEAKYYGMYLQLAIDFTSTNMEKVSFDRGAPMKKVAVDDPSYNSWVNDTSSKLINLFGEAMEHRKTIKSMWDNTNKDYQNSTLGSLQSNYINVVANEIKKIKLRKFKK